MEDLITGAETFANYLRFQLFKKNNQMFRKDVYAHKIWGSQLKGGLEVCDAILLENQEKKYNSYEDLVSRYKDLLDKLKKELTDIDLTSSMLEFSNNKSKQLFGLRKKDKIKAHSFKEDIRISVLRGSYLACKRLLDEHIREPINKLDILLGDVHIVRMNYWNTYRSGNRQRQLREVDVIDTMQVNPANLTMS